MIGNIAKKVQEDLGLVEVPHLGKIERAVEDVIDREASRLRERAAACASAAEQLPDDMRQARTYLVARATVLREVAGEMTKDSIPF